MQNLFWARLPGDVLVILGAGLFSYDVVKKRFVRREETAPTAGGTVISRRIFGEEDDQGIDLGDDWSVVLLWGEFDSERRLRSPVSLFSSRPSFGSGVLTDRDACTTPSRTSGDRTRIAVTVGPYQTRDRIRLSPNCSCNRSTSKDGGTACQTCDGSRYRSREEDTPRKSLGGHSRNRSTRERILSGEYASDLMSRLAGAGDVTLHAAVIRMQSS